MSARWQKSNGTSFLPPMSAENTRQSTSTATDSAPLQNSVHLLTRPLGGGRPEAVATSEASGMVLTVSRSRLSRAHAIGLAVSTRPRERLPLLRLLPRQTISGSRTASAKFSSSSGCSGG